MIKLTYVERCSYCKKYVHPITGERVDELPGYEFKHEDISDCICENDYNEQIKKLDMMVIE